MAAKGKGDGFASLMMERQLIAEAQRMLGDTYYDPIPDTLHGVAFELDCLIEEMGACDHHSNHCRCAAVELRERIGFKLDPKTDPKCAGCYWGDTPGWSHFRTCDLYRDTVTGENK